MKKLFVHPFGVFCSNSWETVLKCCSCLCVRCKWLNRVCKIRFVIENEIWFAHNLQNWPHEIIINNNQQRNRIEKHMHLHGFTRNSYILQVDLFAASLLHSLELHHHHHLHSFFSISNKQIMQSRSEISSNTILPSFGIMTILKAHNKTDSLITHSMSLRFIFEKMRINMAPKCRIQKNGTSKKVLIFFLCNVIFKPFCMMCPFSAYEILKI